MAESKGIQAIIAPSILTADLSQLASECKKLKEQGSDWYHIDVMDGHFVPNFTFGATVVKSLRKNVEGFLDCHLMVTHPQQWLEDFSKAGADQFTYHYEVDVNHEEFCAKIRSTGMRVGIALKPKTQIDDRLRKLVENKAVDMVLIMTVEPGFGGQKFMGDMMGKVSELRKSYPDLDIQVDGGVASENIDIPASAGANVIVSGSGVVNVADPAKAISFMRDRVSHFILENQAAAKQ